MKSVVSLSKNKLLPCNMILQDTICAISTAPGMGAIAIVRLSGTEATTIVDRVFRPAKEGRAVSTLKGGRTVYGHIVGSNGEAIDEVVITIFRNPHSFTGEDIVEIACHGSIYVQQSILNRLIDNGARLARPGEFSKRAFINGKMDLSQTEAVADIISSRSEAARRVAFSQMKGTFSKKLKELREKLVHFCSLLELELDFSDQEVEFADRTQLIELVKEVDKYVDKLASSFKYGDAIKNGTPVAIVGPPNAGKSTLLNILLGEERAIVSDIPGTTRDVIEDTIHMGDVELRLIDTAGIRDTDDKIESIGIERTLQRVGKALIVVVVIDCTMTKGEIEHFSAQLKQSLSKEKKVLLVVNKIDKQQGDAVDYGSFFEGIEISKTVSISAAENKGIDELESALIELSTLKETLTEDIIVTNARHYEALTRAHENLARVLAGLTDGLSGEFVAMDLRAANGSLGEILGEGGISSQEVLNNIFKNFCIGK